MRRVWAKPHGSLVLPHRIVIKARPHTDETKSCVSTGVIGTKVPIFDLWGETVNLASRLESGGFENVIQVSEATYWRVQHLYEFEKREVITLKGGLTVNAFILKGRKLLAPSEDRAQEAAARI